MIIISPKTLCDTPMGHTKKLFNFTIKDYKQYNTYFIKTYKMLFDSYDKNRIKPFNFLINILANCVSHI